MKGVIFDMDGVLVDTVDIFYKAYNKAMECVGGYITEEEYLNRVHLQASKIFEEILEVRGIKADITLLEELKNCMLTKMLKNVKVRKGVNEIVKRLREHNIKYCIATASEREQTDIILKGAGIYYLFDIVVTADDTKKECVKPDIYYIAAKKMGKPVKMCVLVEDSLQNLRMGQRIGMMGIGVVGKYSEKELSAVARYVVKNVGEIKMEWIA